MSHTTFSRRIVVGAGATVVINVLVAVCLTGDARTAPGPAAASSASSFAGSEKCAECHEEAYRAWLGSDHRHAMARADDGTVRADVNGTVFEDTGIKARFLERDGQFFVETQEPDGSPAQHEITYTIGIDPIQQYLVALDGGRLQVLPIAWNRRRGEWVGAEPEDGVSSRWQIDRAYTWNRRCARCHATGVTVNYDRSAKAYATAWSEIGVGCEACHGPGEDHVQWAERPAATRPVVASYALAMPGALAAYRQVELCAMCHSNWKPIGEVRDVQGHLLDQFVPSPPAGERRTVDDAGHGVFVYDTFARGEIYHGSVGCSDCHDVHSLELVRDGNDVCLSCHDAGTYDNRTHRFHEDSKAGSRETQCITCHMPERSFMPGDSQADHSMRPPRPDVTLKTRNVTACGQGGCHDAQPTGWLAEEYERWYATPPTPNDDRILASTNTHDPIARAALSHLAADPRRAPILRAAALSLLGRYPADSTTAAYARALGDEHPLVRYAALHNVDIRTVPRLIGQIGPLLADSLRAVRVQAAVRLAGFPDDLLTADQADARKRLLLEYEEAKTSALDDPNVGYDLGKLHMQMHDWDAAKTYYGYALEADPRFFPAKLDLAIIYDEQGHHVEAEMLLREVIDAHPGEHDVEYLLGQLLVDVDDLEGAAEFFGRAATGFGNRARMFYDLALVEQRLGRLDEAEIAFLRAVELEPNAMDYLQGLADHYLQRGDIDSAVPIVERLLKIHPYSKRTQEMKAYIDRAKDNADSK